MTGRAHNRKLIQKLANRKESSDMPKEKKTNDLPRIPQHLGLKFGFMEENNTTCLDDGDSMQPCGGGYFAISAIINKTGNTIRAFYDDRGRLIIF